MKTKKVISILEEVREELYINDVEIGEDISTKKIMNAMDFAIKAIKENKKLRKENEKLQMKVDKLEFKVEYPDGHTM